MRLAISENLIITQVVLLSRAVFLGWKFKDSSETNLLNERRKFNVLCSLSHKTEYIINNAAGKSKNIGFKSKQQLRAKTQGKVVCKLSSLIYSVFMLQKKNDALKFPCS